MKTNWIGWGTAAACLAMAMAGWNLGGASAAASETDEEDVHEGGNRARFKYRERELGARNRVQAIRLQGTQEERLRLTIKLANSLPPSQFGNWLEGGWFNYRDGYELTLFRKLIEERWQQEDPEGYVAWCLEEGEGGADWATGSPRGSALPILTKWALEDPARFSEFFDKYPDDDLEAELISKLAATHPAVAIERLGDMLSRGSRNNYRLRSAIEALAKSSPAELEGILDTLPGSVRSQAETILIGQKLKTSFDATLRDLWGHPEGWKIFNENRYRIDGLGDKLLEHLAELPAGWRASMSSSMHGILRNSDTEAWIATDFEAIGFTTKQAEGLRASALQTLVSQNPKRALELLPQSGMDESGRLNMIRTLFQRARNEPEKADQWLAMLDNEVDREAAQEVIDAAGQVTPGRTYDSPDEWLEAVISSDEEGQLAHQFGNAVRRWTPDQLGELTEQFGELETEGKNSVASALINGQYGWSGMNRLPWELSGSVLQHLLEQPEEESDGENKSRQLIRLTATTAAQWGADNPGETSEWIAGLPDSDAKLWAQKNLANTWTSYDPDAADQWMGTLPADTRAEVQKYISGN